jgi:hypothetical protein
VQPSSLGAALIRAGSGAGGALEGDRLDGEILREALAVLDAAAGAAAAAGQYGWRVAEVRARALLALGQRGGGDGGGGCGDGGGGKDERRGFRTADLSVLCAALDTADATVRGLRKEMRRRRRGAGVGAGAGAGDADEEEMLEEDLREEDDTDDDDDDDDDYDDEVANVNRLARAPHQRGSAEVQIEEGDEEEDEEKATEVEKAEKARKRREALVAAAPLAAAHFTRGVVLAAVAAATHAAQTTIQQKHHQQKNHRHRTQTTQPGTETTQTTQKQKLTSRGHKPQQQQHMSSRTTKNTTKMNAKVDAAASKIDDAGGGREWREEALAELRLARRLGHDPVAVWRLHARVLRATPASEATAAAAAAKKQKRAAAAAASSSQRRAEEERAWGLAAAQARQRLQNNTSASPSTRGANSPASPRPGGASSPPLYNARSPNSQGQSTRIKSNGQFEWDYSHRSPSASSPPPRGMGSPRGARRRANNGNSDRGDDVLGAVERALRLARANRRGNVGVVAAAPVPPAVSDAAALPPLAITDAEYPPPPTPPTTSVRIHYGRRVAMSASARLAERAELHAMTARWGLYKLNPVDTHSLRKRLISTVP